MEAGRPVKRLDSRARAEERVLIGIQLAPCAGPAYACCSEPLARQYYT